MEMYNFFGIFIYLFITQTDSLAIKKANNPLKIVPCNFQDGICPGYELDKTADIEWKRKSGPTPSNLTGPDGDNTPGYNGQGYYMYIDASNKLNKKEARLYTKHLDQTITKGQSLCLEFFYHMRGHTMGEFSVGIIDTSTNNEEVKFHLKGDQKNTKWLQGRFAFKTPNAPYKIVFKGTTSFSYYGDIGLDDINLRIIQTGTTCNVWPTKASPQRHNLINKSPFSLINSDTSPENQTTCGRRKVWRRKVGRVVVGQQVKPIGKWPWMAMIARRSGQQYIHICGGTLLSNKWIVTAAHCVVNVPSRDVLRVRLGAHQLTKDLPQGTQIIGVKTIYVHEGYREETEFNKDIALIELERPAMMSNYVESICLPNDKSSQPGKRCMVAGWGYRWNTNKDIKPSYSDVLNEGEVRLKPYKDCKKNFKDGQITPYMLCAKGENKVTDTCKGDSGGPLMCEEEDGRWSLVGITSWGDKMGCGTIGKYGVYTNMTILKDWVINITSNPQLAKSLF